MPIQMSAICKEIYLKDTPNKLPQNADTYKYNYKSRHPAYKLIDKYGWNTFYYQLQNVIQSQKYLKITMDKVQNTKYELINYTADQFKQWNEYIILCRGLIIDKKKQKIIAAPFPKFFNYSQYHKNDQKYISNQFNTNKEKNEEKKKDSLKNEYGIFEKVDGSLGICFYCEYSKKWRISTRGSFVSHQSQWANLYISDKNMDNTLIRGHSYMFEIIYKENKIGVDYGSFEGLILLNAYNDDGFEYKYEYLKVIASRLEFKVAMCYNEKYHNIDDLLKAQHIIDKNKEGFVLCLENGFRIKFKGKEYLNMIKIKNYSSTTEMKKNIRTMIVMKGVLEKNDVLKDYEDEFCQEIGNIFDDIYNDLLNKTECMVHDLVMTNNLNKGQLQICQQKLNNDVKWIAKARKVCDPNLWKSYLGKKSNKKVIGKVVQRITNELLEKKEWRVFIVKHAK